MPHLQAETRHHGLCDRRDAGGLRQSRLRHQPAHCRAATIAGGGGARGGDLYARLSPRVLWLIAPCLTLGEPGSPTPPPAGGFGRATPARVGQPGCSTPLPVGGPGPQVGVWATGLPHPLRMRAGGPRTQAPPAGGFGRAQPSQEQSYVHPVGARRSRVDG